MDSQYLLLSLCLVVCAVVVFVIMNSGSGKGEEAIEIGRDCDEYGKISVDTNNRFSPTPNCEWVGYCDSAPKNENGGITGVTR